MCSQPLTANRYHLSRACYIANRVLGAGVEPAHLAAPEPKSGVSAIPPPERACFPCYGHLKDFFRLVGRQITIDANHEAYARLRGKQRAKELQKEIEAKIAAKKAGK